MKTDADWRNITPTAEQLEELEQRHQDLLAENMLPSYGTWVGRRRIGSSSPPCCKPAMGRGSR